LGKELVMKKQLLLAAVVFTVVALAGSALAIGPLGPPTAGLKQGQFGLAIEYGYSNSDIKVSGSGAGDTLDDVKSNAFIAQPGFGVTDDLEVYALLGGADARFDGFNDGYDFAYGFGTKLTFLKETDRSWGAMFEMDWRSAEDSGADIDYYEMTIAIGPTLHITDIFRIYGGPFFYILNGDIDVDDGGGSEGPPVPIESIRTAGISAMSLSDLSGNSYDLEEESGFGGYIGAELDLNPNTSWYNEFQFTGNSGAFGTGIKWKF
jgi:opacity protein-like surface antigen